MATKAFIIRRMNPEQILQQLSGQVFAKQTVLAEVFSVHGKKSVFDYSNSWSVDRGSLNGEALAVVQKLFGQVYGAEIAQGVARQLQSSQLVSTIDHHGILNHPFFVNSNLIYSLRENLDYLVVFSTAGISLNNSSWPGCLVVNHDGKLERFSLFPDHAKTQTLLWTKAYTEESLERAKKHISLSTADGITKNTLHDVCDRVLGERDVLAAEDFSKQSSMVSSRLWEMYFPKAPKLVTVPVEDIVGSIILELINPDLSHPLHRLLYTQDGWDLLEKHFDGWLGAFIKMHKGSFLFWGLGRKGRRTHLSRQGENLAGEGLNFKPDPKIVSELLEQRQIYPTSLLCFLVLLWYRFTCLGGFNQVNWLTDIKLKFVHLLNEMGETAAAGSINNVETKNFAESNLAFIPHGDGIIKATGMDLLLNQNINWWPVFQKLSREITVEQSILTLLPEMYRVITPSPMRDPQLLSLTDEQAALCVGLTHKLRSLLN